MPEKDKQIIETFGKALPQMSESEKDRLLAFGEGIAFKTEQQARKKNPASEHTEQPSA